MKIKNLFFSMLACAALFACSSDDENLGGAQTSGLDEAYMTIQVFNANGATRGDIGNNTNGSTAENNVKTVDFYFYNNDGTFNQHVDMAGTALAPWTGQTNGNNVEMIGNATVVLKNLKQKGQPKYVVAVLNSSKTGDKYMYLNLAELKTELIKESEGYATDKSFLITNSTYNNQDATSQYFATTIKDGNFLKEKPEKDELNANNAVKIYVERLAAKVTLGFNTTNLANTDEITVGKYEVDGAEQELKIKITGWGLNATTKDSYLMKNVPAWDFDATWTAWDKKENYRSHWAMSTNYNDNSAKYPTSYGFETVGDELNDITGTETLNYYAWSKMTKKAGEIEYCMENTNKADVLQANNNIKATATHILLAAELTTSDDLVRFYGQLYTKDGFLKNVLSQLTTKYFKPDGASGYKQIEITDIEVADAFDGKVYVKLTSAAEALNWYTDAGTTSAPTTDINTALLKIFNDGATSSREYAEYYKGGKMYYCIPIEHIRGGTIDYAAANDGTYTVDEGDFGVVRNHFYNITVNSIKNLGTAVYNLDELIVPNPEIPTYFVGASINILAWQIVTQGVDL